MVLGASLLKLRFERFLHRDVGHLEGRLQFAERKVATVYECLQVAVTVPDKGVQRGLFKETQNAVPFEEGFRNSRGEGGEPGMGFEELQL